VDETEFLARVKSPADSTLVGCHHTYNPLHVFRLKIRILHHSAALYTPPVCLSAERRIIRGNPYPEDINTSGY
jgi:hypothetical protein